MKNSFLSPPRRQSSSHGCDRGSRTNSCVDLRLSTDAGLVAPSPSTMGVDGACVSTQIAAMGPVCDGETKPPDSPRQLTMSLPSETPLTESILVESCGSEPSAACKSEGGSMPRSGGRRGSATMKSFLQRVMRTQSESHIRITPVASTKHDESSSQERPPVVPTNSSIREGLCASCCLRPAVIVETQTRKSADIYEDESGDEDGDDRTARTYKDGDLPGASLAQLHQSEPALAASNLCDVFLNSSLQLLQVQSDAKQRVRQLWTCAQRLRWENQLSDSGLELLHQELLNVMKALTVEKLEGARHIKSGYLTLVQAPPALLAANMMQRGAAAATKSLLFGAPRTTIEQRVWVTVSEEQCRLELVPVKNEPMSTQPPACPAADQQSQGLGAIGKFKLPTSISWLLSDPLQKDDDATACIGRTNIKLQGCQVRRLPAQAGDVAARTRFQLLVPHSDSSAAAGVPTTGSTMTVVPDAGGANSSPTSSFGIYIFEVCSTSTESSEDPLLERDEWMRAIERVCMFHLYALERQLREACFMLQFCDLLAMHFPVCVPLTWLRNRIERPGGSGSGCVSMTAQQQATFQQQQLQRRSSRNLSMVQIVKDLERDRILVDKTLLISCMGKHGHRHSTSSSSLTTLSDGTTVVEHDSVAEIVKYLVGKAMAFARRTSQTNKAQPQSTGPTGKPPPADLAPSSPSSRLTKFTEARALAFVERVLRGSSRTQSGGDIYDAISFFCQQRNLSICPTSHDAHPVILNVVEDDDQGAFHVEIEVSMQFKVVEMPSMDAVAPSIATPREWAVLEGTLLRQFTLGKLSEPGTVTVKYLPDDLNARVDGDTAEY